MSACVYLYVRMYMLYALHRYSIAMEGVSRYVLRYMINISKMQLFKQLFDIPLLRWKENINAATHWPPYETNNQEKNDSNNKITRFAINSRRTMRNENRDGINEPSRWVESNRVEFEEYMQTNCCNWNRDVVEALSSSANVCFGYVIRLNCYFEIVSKLFLEMSDYLRYLLHQLTFTIISSRWKITILSVSFALKSRSVCFCTLLRWICYNMNWNLHLKLLLPCNFIRCLARPLSLLLLLISFELQYKRDGNCIQTSRSMAVLCPCDFIIALKKNTKYFCFIQFVVESALET